MNHSIVQYLSKDSSSCGYCKSSSENVSHGLWAHTLTVEDYQNLIDRGWRRCGLYCYKPVMNEICCPAYTIRCDALNLKLTKSQKKVLRHFNVFLRKPENTNEDTNVESRSLDSDDIGFKIPKPMEHNLQPLSASEKEMTAVFVQNSTEALGKRKMIPNNVPEPEMNVEKVSLQTKTKPGVGEDESKPKCKKAKLLRMERRNEKLQRKGITELPPKTTAKISEKTLEDYINECEGRSEARKLEFTTLPSEVNKKFLFFYKNSARRNTSRETKNMFSTSLERVTLCAACADLVHELGGSSPWTLTLVPACSDETIIKESWLLYKKYQTVIHNDKEDECTFSGFSNFLVSSPLQPYKDDDSPPSGYGSFHQLYRLDGKLIAVGVIDVLPRCISSVYFFYDPAYSHLSLGTYGSLRELEITRNYAKKCPLLNQYYLGFYIHSCAKMRYKGKIQPSYLLCPEAYTWHPIVPCLSKIDVSKYSRLNDDPNAKSEEDNVNVDEISVLTQRGIVPYPIFKTVKNLSTEDQGLINEYAFLVGKTTSKRMFLRWR